MVPLFSRSNQLVLFWTPRWFQVSACKLPDPLVGLNVDDPLGGFVVIDGPPVFPKLINNVVYFNHPSELFQVSACSIFVLLSACKLPDPLVGWTVDDWLGGLVVVDCPPVFPEFMNNVFTIITSEFRYWHAVFILCFLHASYLIH